MLPPAVVVNGVNESTAEWRDQQRSRDIPVRIYAPSGPAPYPVVVFSHGIGEDRDSYAYLGRALAGAGFLAVHVTHAGTDKATLCRGYLHLYRATKNPQTWRDRPRDISFVLDRIASRSDADMSRVAVVGHSAGAFTAFALAGVYGPGGESLADPRVRVIVPMSMPRIDPLIYDRVVIPALNITGACDASLLYRTFPRHRRVPFERSHGPNQYLATIARVNHDTFSNATDRHHAAIVDLTLAFLRAWLESDAAAKAWFDDPGTGMVDGDEVALEKK
ncbi:MAG TPA: alpha/beta fold hydrolase [Rhodothermales bacterium]